MNKQEQAHSLRARLVESVGIELLGVQPEARRIRPSRYGRLHGQHPVMPGHPAVLFESGLESLFLDRAVELAGFESVRAQPVTIHYKMEGSARANRYTPDFLLQIAAPLCLCGVLLQRRSFIEVKPLEVALEAEVQLRHKFSAVRFAMHAAPVLITDADLTMWGLNDV